MAYMNAYRLLLAMCRRYWTPLLLAVAVSVPGMAAADPLHSVGGSSLWRHEFSGWLFPTEVGGLQRDGYPYQLDGGDNAGVRYQSSVAPGHSLEVEILLGTDSPALEGGLPFKLAAAPQFVGTRVVANVGGATVARYQFVHEAWTVRIVATAADSGGPAATSASVELATVLDAAVNALPWGSLGSAERLH
jgi:hypothetical protein